MGRPVELMGQLAAQARRFVASGAAPVPPRLAATVLLLRPTRAGGVEVFLIRRAATMAFASGMYAFPGGAVDPADWDGPPVGGDRWRLLGRPPAEAQAVVRAAVREVIEETGVRVAPAALVPWSRWVTPEFEPRRYDAQFFVVALPSGQDPDPAAVSGEADHAEWAGPADAVARAAAGELAMLPPTEVTLGEIAGYESVPAVLAGAADRDPATPILPRITQTATGTIHLTLTP